MVATVIPAVALTHTRRGPTSPKLLHKRVTKTSKLGPRAMDSERATQIQNALIKSGYLTGEASGHWDTQSEAAMQKLQADNGWQTKLIPDSRALIKLGLGPNSTAAATTASIPAASQQPLTGSRSCMSGNKTGTGRFRNVCLW